jgi:osmotically-inducible protein OsmY
MSQTSDYVVARASVIPRSSVPQRAQVAAVAQFVERRLRSSPYADLRSVCVTEQDGALRLDGQVRSFYAKQLAQILARDGNEVCRIDNALNVA